MNPGTFDQLTRRFVTRFSRRTLIGGAMGILAFGAAASREPVRADGWCKTPGVKAESFASLTEMASCSNVVQIAPPATNDMCDVPFLNGQIPFLVDGTIPVVEKPRFSDYGGDMIRYFGDLEVWVLSSVLSVPRDHSLFASFVPACQQHDRCFSTCGTTQTACDEAFLSDLHAACERAYVPGDQLYELCIEQAEIYVLGVDVVTGPFESEQLKHCKCCKDPVSADRTETAGTDSGSTSWPTDRHDTAPGLYIWIGSATAWGIPGINGMPDWVACDDARDYCLLGYTGGDEVLVEIDDLEVVGTIAEWYPDPKEALLILGMTEEVADQILGI
jgi:hypothetical protein